MDIEERKQLAAKRSSEVNKGNTNSSKINRLLGDTLKRKLIQDEAKRANKVVDALLTKAEDGDVHAIKEVLDRSDGKVQTDTKISGDSEEPLMIKVVTGIDDND
jgi:hypothetical protein